MGTVDIENAQATLDKTLKSSDSLVMTESDLEKANELLRSYGSQRDDLQKKMVSLLAQYDPSGLDSDWVEYCGTGRESLKNINSSVPGQNGGGLADLGLGSFYRGEMSIWTENARAEIALRAKEMKTIHLANLKLIQDCNEDLKKVLSDEQDVQRYVEGTIGALIDVLKKTAVFLYAIVQIKNYKGQPSVPDQIKEVGNQMVQSIAQAIDAANKKNALLKILGDRMNLLKDLRSKLSKDAIKIACETGVKTAESLCVAGRDSPYEARDWDDFGKDCKDKLQEESERSIKDADILFEMLFNRLDEETQKSFETLSNDPAQWQRWEDDIGQSFESIEDNLENIQKYVDSLAESKIREGLSAALITSKTMVKANIEDWKKTLNEIKDKLRRS